MQLDQLKQELNRLNQINRPKTEDASDVPAEHPGEAVAKTATESLGRNIARRLELNRMIEGLRRDLRESREREQKRITREFSQRRYAIRYNASMETVVRTLFGSETVTGNGFAAGGRKVRLLPGAVATPMCL